MKFQITIKQQTQAINGKAKHPLYKTSNDKYFDQYKGQQTLNELLQQSSIKIFCSECQKQITLDTIMIGYEEKPAHLLNEKQKEKEKDKPIVQKQKQKQKQKPIEKQKSINKPQPANFQKPKPKQKNKLMVPFKPVTVPIPTAGRLTRNTRASNTNFQHQQLKQLNKQKQKSSSAINISSSSSNQPRTRTTRAFNKLKQQFPNEMSSTLMIGQQQKINKQQQKIFFDDQQQQPQKQSHQPQKSKPVTLNQPLIQKSSKTNTKNSNFHQNQKPNSQMMMNVQQQKEEVQAQQKKSQLKQKTNENKKNISSQQESQDQYESNSQSSLSSSSGSSSSSQRSKKKTSQHYKNQGSHLQPSKQPSFNPINNSYESIQQLQDLEDLQLQYFQQPIIKAASSHKKEQQGQESNKNSSIKEINDDQDQEDDMSVSQLSDLSVVNNVYVPAQQENTKTNDNAYKNQQIQENLQGQVTFEQQHNDNDKLNNLSNNRNPNDTTNNSSNNHQPNNNSNTQPQPQYITRLYCVCCFASLQSFPISYSIRKSLRFSSNSSPDWRVFDELCLLNAMQIWGFGNWQQIKEFMDYNLAFFTLDQIQSHYQQAYIKCNGPLFYQPFDITQVIKPPKKYICEIMHNYYFPPSSDQSLPNQKKSKIFNQLNLKRQRPLSLDNNNNVSRSQSQKHLSSKQPSKSIGTSNNLPSINLLKNASFNSNTSLMKDQQKDSRKMQKEQQSDEDSDSQEQQEQQREGSGNNFSEIKLKPKVSNKGRDQGLKGQHSNVGGKSLSSSNALYPSHNQNLERSSGLEGSPLSQSLLKGNNVYSYNPRRKQFQIIQYDYYAQSMIAQLEFTQDDTQEQKNLKLDIIEQYNRRLDQRLKRRQFVIQHRLLDTQFMLQNIKKYRHGTKVKKFQPFRRLLPKNQEYSEIIQLYDDVCNIKSLTQGLTRVNRKLSTTTCKNPKYKDLIEYLNKKKQKKQLLGKKQKSANSQLKVYIKQERRQQTRNVNNMGNNSLGGINNSTNNNTNTNNNNNNSNPNKKRILSMSVTNNNNNTNNTNNEGYDQSLSNSYSRPMRNLRNQQTNYNSLVSTNNSSNENLNAQNANSLPLANYISNSNNNNNSNKQSLSQQLQSTQSYPFGSNIDTMYNPNYNQNENNFNYNNNKKVYQINSFNNFLGNENINQQNFNSNLQQTYQFSTPQLPLTYIIPQRDIETIEQFLKEAMKEKEKKDENQRNMALQYSQKSQDIKNNDNQSKQQVKQWQKSVIKNPLFKLPVSTNSSSLLQIDKSGRKISSLNRLSSSKYLVLRDLKDYIQ